MKIEKEITVKVNSDYKKLDKDLKNKGFKVIDKYQLNDVYLIPKDVEINMNNELELLKKCVLVRDVVGIGKQMVYKYKKYADNGDIIEQGKTECKIYDVNDAIKFLETIGYKILFKIYDTITVYTDENIEIAVQQVNDKHIFIEMESEGDTIDKKYDTVEEMIEELNSYNIDFDKSNYFVKKALITFREEYK